jgi:hypothetical protein
MAALFLKMAVAWLVNAPRELVDQLGSGSHKREV